MKPVPSARYIGPLAGLPHFLRELLQAATAPTATTRHPAAHPSVLPRLKA